MTLTNEKKALETQQDITQKTAKENRMGVPKLRVDPNECPGCRRIKLACKCAGGSDSGKNDDDNVLDKAQDQTNSLFSPQLTPFKFIPFSLVLLPSRKKVTEEHLKNSELYEIQERKTPQDILAFFNAYLRRLAITQNKTLEALAKEGFSGKIENGVVLLIFPNSNEREKFRQIIVDPKIGLIKSLLLNPSDASTVAQQMVARLIAPKNRLQE